MGAGSLRRWAVIGLVTIVGALAVTGGADAKSRRRCEVEPFSFPAGTPAFAQTLPDDVYRLEWTTSAPTNFDCGRRGILGVDVWEHAYYLVEPSDDGSDLVTVHGRVEYRLTGDFDGDGTADVVSLAGRISGDGVDQDDVVTFAFKARGRSRDGSRLKLHHIGTLDVRGEEWRDLDVRSGIFDPATSFFIG